MEADAVIEVLGVHPVPGLDDCYLIEAIVRGLSEAPDLGSTTQRSDGPASDWQVAYDEKLLDADGRAITAELFTGHRPDSWPSEARVAFYFHGLKVSEPLLTPWGDVQVPTPTPTPDRLTFLAYEAP